MPEPRYLSEEMIQRLDKSLAEAYESISSESVGRATVAITFVIGRDDENEIVGNFTHKHTTTEKGEWQPARQPALKFG